MYVITDTGAIVCFVVIAKYTEAFTLADSNLRYVRYEIIWNALWILADQTALVGPDRIEIAEQNDIPGIVSGVQVGENLF